ncbi:hypothetical protein ACC860_36860, partial [Rhizobium ruizarguesonis]
LRADRGWRARSDLVEMEIFLPDPKAFRGMGRPLQGLSATTGRPPRWSAFRVSPFRTSSSKSAPSPIPADA